MSEKQEILCERCGESVTHIEEDMLYLCNECHDKYQRQSNYNYNEFTGLEEFKKAGELILLGLQKMGFDFEEGDYRKDPNFKSTPNRVGRAYYEIFKGVIDTDSTVENILSTKFPSEYDNLVCEKGIKVFSMCPHHLLPVEYEVDVAYLTKPGGGVLGISKLARLVEVLASAPRLQEDFTQDIGKNLEKVDIMGAYIKVTGQHSCMRMRGAKARESTLVTSYCSQTLRENPALRTELMTILK